MLAILNNEKNRSILKALVWKGLCGVSLVVFVPLKHLIKFDAFWKLFNFLYENAPWWIINFIDPFILIPNMKKEWLIKLVNGKSVKTLIDPDDIKTWHFAHSYKWHVPSINLLEYSLDQYYPQSTYYIDVGANLGLRSLFSLSNSRPTIMIEPNPQVNQLNSDRARLNGFCNFEIVEKGVSSSEELTRFYIDKSSYLSSFKEEVIPKEKIDLISEVHTIKLDNFLESRSISHEFFAKIDVEGLEWEVIKGAMASIKRFNPSLIIEINEKGEHIQQIFTFFSAYEYHVFSIARVPRHKRFLRKIEVSQQPNEFLSNDFLFVKNPELVEALRPYFLPG